MIPPLDQRGYLPPGVHPATLEDVEARFGRESEMRRVQMESLVWLVDLARRAGAARLVVNGSFVTAVEEPNDWIASSSLSQAFPRTPARKRS